jgi:hypothetical protein
VREVVACGRRKQATAVLFPQKRTQFETACMDPTPIYTPGLASGPQAERQEK